MSPRGIGHEWRAKATEVDFLKNKGGFYAVSLTLSTANASQLSRNIQQSLQVADRHREEREESIEIIAHWGRKTKAKPGEQAGFQIRTRVKPRSL